jgi:CDP-6-deoxy-D-xylo-4-hexulose-3-dehydrase
MNIPLVNDTISNNDMDKLADWIKTHPKLTMGEVTKEFEEKWSQWIGRKYSVFVNSGSSANLLMYAAAKENLKLNVDHTVAIQGMSWATTVMPAMQLGMKPELIDVSPLSWGMDVSALRKTFNDRLPYFSPRVVTVVHTIGCPVDMNEIVGVQSDHGFLLLEDCCSSYGSTINGRKVGTYGDMSSFSMYFAHQMSTIEGGIISTDNKELYNLLLMMRSHGWAKDLDQESEVSLATTHGRLDFNRSFTFYVPGFNVRSTDLQAYLGLMQLDRIDDFVSRRIQNHNLYIDIIKELRLDVSYQMTPYNTEVCSISFGLKFATHGERKRAAWALQEGGVDIRPLGGGSMGSQPFWVNKYGKIHLPICDILQETTLMVPNHPEMNEESIRYVCNILRSLQ